MPFHLGGARMGGRLSLLTCLPLIAFLCTACEVDGMALPAELASLHTLETRVERLPKETAAVQRFIRASV